MQRLQSDGDMPDETQPLNNPDKRIADHHARYGQLYAQMRSWSWRLLGGHPEGEPRHHLARVVELFILLLILGNVGMLLASSTVDNVVFDNAYRWFELVSAILFSVEYFLRLWTAVEDPQYKAPFTGRLRWALSPLNVLDLVCLLPFVVDLILPPEDTSYRGATAIRLLRLLRLFALLRLERGLKAFSRIHAVLKHKGSELLVTVYVAGIFLVLSSSLMPASGSHQRAKRVHTYVLTD